MLNRHQTTTDLMQTVWHGTTLKVIQWQSVQALKYCILNTSNEEANATELFNEIIENGSKVIESDVLCD